MIYDPSPHVRAILWEVLCAAWPCVCRAMSLSTRRLVSGGLVIRARPSGAHDRVTCNVSDTDADNPLRWFPRRGAQARTWRGRRTRRGEARHPATWSGVSRAAIQPLTLQALGPFPTERQDRSPSRPCEVPGLGSPEPRGARLCGKSARVGEGYARRIRQEISRISAAHSKTLTLRGFWSGTRSRFWLYMSDQCCIAVAYGEAHS